MSQIIDIKTNTNSETVVESVANNLEPQKTDSKGKTDEKVIINPADYMPVIDLTGKSDEEIISLAEKRIERQSNISSGPVPAILIYKWVVKELKNNTEFAKQTLIRSKSLQKSFDYVMGIVLSVSRQMKATKAE